MKKMIHRINEYIVFFRYSISNIHEIGAVVPTTKALGNEITTHIKPSATPQKILEIGAGTGVITITLTEKMGPNDKLTSIEINPRFCEILRKKFHDNPQVTIHEGSILDFPFKEDTYDTIVCSLPIVLFPPSELTSVMEGCQKSLKEGGMISYLDSSAIRFKTLQVKFLPKIGLSILALDAFTDKHNIIRKKTIWLQIPPMTVHHLQILPEAKCPN